MKRKHSEKPESGRNKNKAGKNIKKQDDKEDFSDDREEESSESDGAEESPDEEMIQQKIPELDKKMAVKTPTHQEIYELKEAENQLQSSLFQMQIKELLSEVQLPSKRETAVDDYIERLKDILVNLPSSREDDLINQTWLTRDVCVPILQQPFQVKGKFQFLPPRSVNIIGSYPLGTSVRPTSHVDLALQIPSESIHNKDYLNQRYLRKRALYLAVVAKHLKDCPLVESLGFSYHHGNHMKPILILNPAGKLGKGIKVCLHTCIDPSVFKLHRFHVAKNNVRRQWFFQTADSKQLKDDDTENQPATPLYNANMLQDILSERHLETMISVMAQSQAAKEGVTLCKVWLHQRRLNQGCGSFSGFLMTMFIVHLIKTQKLNSSMNSFQLLRNTLINLAQADWISLGVSMASKEEDKHRPSVEDFHKAYDVVFIDPSGYLNLCANMNKTVFSRVKHEASLSLEHLSAPSLDGFEALFMTPVFFNTKFDHTLHIHTLKNLTKCVTEKHLEEKLLDSCNDCISACMPHLVATLDRAVGKRVHLLQVYQPNIAQWSITDNPPAPSNCDLHIGLLVNPELGNSIVEKGPPADTVEAKSFRQFWGEKSELRRFQDGAISEAVVWSCSTLSQRRLLICKMLTYILNTQVCIPKSTISFLGAEINQVLRPPKVHNVEVGVYGTGEEQHIDVMKSYDTLCKQLRALDQLPLTITSIQGISSVFRYAEVFPAMPARYDRECPTVKGRQIPQPDCPTPPYTPALKVQCLLESSGKWPEDHAALRRVKAAFHIQMAEQLTKQYHFRTLAHPEHVDILKDGFLFRVEIGSHREVSLLKMVKRTDGMLQMVETQAAQELERRVVTLPKLTSALHGLQQQHGSYCSAVRLAKRWIGSQMLSDHVPEEAVELMMAYLFTSPAPYTVPNSPLTGFVRLLRLLSTRDWKISPLVVNLNNEFTREDLMDIQSLFTKQRANLPLMYIATPYDKVRSEWTRNQPSAPILHRLVLLAQESLSAMQTLLDNPGSHVDFKLIFRPPLDVYNALIYLRPTHVNKHYQAVDLAPHTYIPKIKKSEEKTSMPVIDYDPVQLYLKELREAFGDIALFFYDPMGGTVIGVLWKPSAFKGTSFKIGSVQCHMLSGDSSGSDAVMVPNVAAILEDFRVIGQGLVRKVETNAERL